MSSTNVVSKSVGKKVIFLPTAIVLLGVALGLLGDSFALPCAVGVAVATFIYLLTKDCDAPTRKFFVGLERMFLVSALIVGLIGVIVAFAPSL